MYLPLSRKTFPRIGNQSRFTMGTQNSLHLVPMILQVLLVDYHIIEIGCHFPLVGSMDYVQKLLDCGWALWRLKDGWMDTLLIPREM